ncbi:MAG: energy transducer TonB [Candidatus Omnitrophica bacterium]|nr:energy transducer TonB [Candidatus Omnitrophota bacterium]
MRDLWGLSLGVSLAVHLLILTGLPTVRDFNVQRKKKKEIRIFPKEFKKIPKIDNFTRQEAFLKRIPPYIEEKAKKTILDSRRKFFLEKPRINPSLKKIVFTDSSDDEEIKKSPVYLNYYRMIREKIREKAYSYYNSEESGMVHLSFVIFKNGILKGLNLVDASTASKDLVMIAVKSIREAAPFPPFPEELNYSQLHFNVSIHFKSN